MAFCALTGIRKGVLGKVVPISKAVLMENLQGMNPELTWPTLQPGLGDSAPSPPCCMFILNVMRPCPLLVLLPHVNLICPFIT